MLAALQRNWLSCLYPPGKPGTDGLLGARDARRFEIYRAGVQANLTQALAATYPVIDKLVGHAYFEAAARCYVQDHPSREGDIHAFGDAFSEFLREFEPARALPYLPDVAQLEWYAHCAFHAADPTALDISSLGALTDAQLAVARLDLHPGVFWMRSDYPVHRIWHANQADAAEVEVDLDAGGVNLAVMREKLEVVLMPLETADFDFLSALRTHDLAAACDLTLLRHADFDAGSALHLAFSHGLIVRIKTGGKSCTHSPE